MTTRIWAWLMLPGLLLLSGCPDGGGDVVSGGRTPTSVAVSPNGDFLYVSNRGTNSVSAYTIGVTGGLTPIAGSPFSTGTNPSAVTISPNGDFLFVSNQGSNDVSGYTIGGSGSLTPIAGSPFSSGTTPSGVAVSPNSGFLYVSNQGSNNVSAYTITPVTGVLVPLTGLQGNPFLAGTNPSAVTVSPNGSFLYVSNQGSNNVSAYTIGGGGILAQATGSPFPTGTTPSGVAVSPNSGFLYVSNQGSNNVSAYTITIGTGVLVALNPILGNPFLAGTNPSAVTVSPNGSFLYVSNQGSDNVSAYTIGGGGVLAQVTGSPFPTGTTPSGVAVSPNSGFLYVSNQGSNNISAYSITIGTGALAAVAGSPF